MDILNERVVKVMKVKGLAKTEFASLLDISLATLSHINSGRNKPSVEVLQKIAVKYQDISLEWLLLGEGEMFKPQAVDLESIIEEVKRMETRTQEGIDVFVGVRELLKEQVISLLKKK